MMTKHHIEHNFYKYRHYNFTTCIDFDELDTLEKNISQLLEKEYGCYRIYNLPELDFDYKQSSLYAESKLLNLWIVCLFKGKLDRWTIVKTFPTGLICSRASNSSKSRISNLTKQMRCNSFHLEVTGGISGFLFESNAKGITFLSGCPGEEYFNNFYDEPNVDRPDLINNFFLIDVSESIKNAIRINESPEAKKQEKIINQMNPDDPGYFDLLDAKIDHTYRIDLALAELFDPDENYWFTNHNLAYKVYNQLEELESIEAKILYFHPPYSYEPNVQLKNNSSIICRYLSKQDDL